MRRLCFVNHFEKSRTRLRAAAKPLSDIARLISRRAALKRVAAAPAVALAGCRSSAVVRSRPNDIRIVDVTHEFENHRYRTPYQFGGRTVDRVTILNVYCRVRTEDGREARGFGSMTLGNAWAFPAASQDEGLGAMTALADALRPITASCDDTGHPIDLFRVLEPAYLREAATLAGSRGLSTPIPKLCTLVVASAFDAAIHDAYGKAIGVSTYATYGSAFMTRDLSTDLGPAFRGEYLDRYVATTPQPTMPVFHSVGASDPIESSDVRVRINDGWPNTLEEWIATDGLIRFKIKLNGGDLEADFERVVRIDRVVSRALNAKKGERLEVLPGLQRRLPECRLSPRVPAAVARGDATRVRPNPLHRAADITRTRARSRETSCTRRPGSGRSSPTRRSQISRACCLLVRWATPASR